jgi:hypothetical protein
MAKTAKEQPPQDSVAGELAALKEKVGLLQRFGPLTDEELAAKKLEAERKVRHAADIVAREERRRVEEEAARKEIRKIAGEELGKRIILAVNGQRINTLLPDGSVPCPGCGAPISEATGILLQMADLLRQYRGRLADLYVRAASPMGFGGSGEGVPAVRCGAFCPACKAGYEVASQLVII